MSRNEILFARKMAGKKDNRDPIEAGDEARRRLGIYGQPADPFKWWARFRAAHHLDSGMNQEQTIETVMYEYCRRVVTGIHRSEDPE